ncbi:MAG: transcriptional repressor [Balneolaceae bacterium]|nr:transcriptional repressor [Balneolaceae bacterium]
MERRKTQSTEEILSTLKDTDFALSHKMIQQRLSIEVDRATIYRVLNRFLEDGIVHRVISENGKQYFALCEDCERNDHHHNHFHFRCNKCGKVECLAREVDIQLPAGYTAENINSLVTGICASCR